MNVSLSPLNNSIWRLFSFCLSLEQRNSIRLYHFTRLEMDGGFSPSQVILASANSRHTNLFYVNLDRPWLLFPCVFQSSGIQVMLSGFFLGVWPMDLKLEVSEWWSSRSAMLRSHITTSMTHDDDGKYSEVLRWGIQGQRNNYMT